MPNVVIYEDDVLMRALLEEWLCEAGYDVSARASRDVRRDDADVVVASVYMPKRAGVEALREIRAAHPNAALIAVSGQFRAGLSVDGAAVRVPGVEHVIAKPLRRDDLLEAVRAMIGAPS
jgi:DNA-binding NarL/FixJ family response regulator